MRPLVFYHAQCRDGQASAWVAQQAMPHAELIPVQYGTPPDLQAASGREVYVIDFSWKRADMKALLMVANRLVVLDHHKTAKEELADLLLEEVGRGADDATIVFDMERSGAGIAWDYFFPNNPRPWFIDYVEDRDLWRWALPHSRGVSAWISTLSYRPDAFNTFDLNAADREEAVTSYAALGTGAEAAVRAYCSAACENAYDMLVTWGHGGGPVHSDIVPSVSACQHSISEVLEHLMDLRPGAPFVVGWWRRRDGTYQYSLRSRGDYDVSEIAKVYGGGGHRNAAGFQSGLLLS